MYCALKTSCCSGRVVVDSALFFVKIILNNIQGTCLMKLDELQKHWDTYAKIDPLWAVLTDSSKKDGKWDIKDFFQTGTAHIESIFLYLESIKVSVVRKRALDFGCGVGRLTQALCNCFNECVGIDIAPQMIELANQFNQHVNRCKYYVNNKSDLSLFQSDSFDFIFTWLVLQHIEPPAM